MSCTFVLLPRLVLNSILADLPSFWFLMCGSHCAIKLLYVIYMSPVVLTFYISISNIFFLIFQSLDVERWERVTGKYLRDRKSLDDHFQISTSLRQRRLPFAIPSHVFNRFFTHTRFDSRTRVENHAWYAKQYLDMQLKMEVDEKA